MRSDQESLKPLGAPVRKEQDKPGEYWLPVAGAPGVFRSSVDGRLKTNIPKNENASWSVSRGALDWWIQCRRA